MAQQVLIRLQKVLQRTGLSRSTVYWRISEGTFPKPINLGVKIVAWVEAEIDEWIEKQIAQSRSGQVQ